MNLDRLPEIVEKVKPTRYSLDRGHEYGPLVLRVGYSKPGHAERYEWVWNDGARSHSCSTEDAANACVVALLGRLMKNDRPTTIYMRGVSVDGEILPGDILNALYDAFVSHPEWFALDADEKGVGE